MFAKRKLAVLFVAFFCFVSAPEARAEHIFFDVAINGFALSGTPLDPEIPRLGTSAAQQQPSAPRIVAQDGRFTFTFRIFRDFDEPEPSGAGTLFINFQGSEPGNTLPPPLTNLQFPFNITSPTQNPTVLSFTQQYNSAGVFSGLLVTRLVTADQNDRTGFPVTLVVPTTPVPEPATLVLLGTGIAGVAARARRKRRGSRGRVPRRATWLR